MIAGIIILPVVAGLIALLIPNRFAKTLLLAASVAHSALTVSCLITHPPTILKGWLGFDAPGLLFLSLASLLFLASSIQCLSYLSPDDHAKHGSVGVFAACLLFFLASMTLATASRHLGLLWIAIEATTLSSAPLIYFHRSERSLEATWKYLLICSVGIALALLGTFFLAVSASDGGTIPLVLDDLIRAGAELHTPWLQGAFIFLLVGYGTKMGLAPFHTWLPDAHSEAPSPVSALLSGALLNCAFLGVLRGFQICTANGQAVFAQNLLLGFGIFSMFVAAVFLLHPVDFKRMLAYSSVEHMGILAVGVGLGGAGTMAALFHAVNHSLAKGMLFLDAGNILAAYGTKSIRDVRGALKRIPMSGVLWVTGFLAITGTPPFGTFLSEFAVLRAAVSQGHGGIAVTYLVLLVLAFAGMSGAFLQMTQGDFDHSNETPIEEEPSLSLLAPLVLGTGVLLLGLYVPPRLLSFLATAASSIGGVR